MSWTLPEALLVRVINVTCYPLWKWLWWCSAVSSLWAPSSPPFVSRAFAEANGKEILDAWIEFFQFEQLSFSIVENLITITLQNNSNYSSRRKLSFQREHVHRSLSNFYRIPANQMPIRSKPWLLKFYRLVADVERKRCSRPPARLVSLWQIHRRPSRSRRCSRPLSTAFTTTLNRSAPTYRDGTASASTDLIAPVSTRKSAQFTIRNRFTLGWSDGAFAFLKNNF